MGNEEIRGVVEMDFEEFVVQYQRRTAKRMADFEALMKETQQKMEMTAKHHARARETLPRQPVTVPRGDYSMPRPRRSAAQKAHKQQQIQAVLRAIGPNGENPVA
ncbi:hypothetical protein HMA55_02470 [Corynebacterium sp. zg-913]|uniref:Uncharacterized protein n=1 Tax=Corynebacterium wankanglinii TaxID=2735136 RepID=A0A7V9A194_9CORY|nr:MULTISPECIES: hypothetical protein [Corynebacterium]MBA1836778.1 hypothetical protein [Corynebacterium wankanglinii]